MKILFVSLLVPYPRADHAGASTVYETVKRLARRHTVSLIGFARSEDERAHAEACLKPPCAHVECLVRCDRPWHKLAARARLLAGVPIAVSNGYSREMATRIHGLCQVERFDIVQCEYAPMAQYLPAFGHSCSILNLHDVIAIVAERSGRPLPWSRKKLEWLIDRAVALRYEPNLYARFDQVLALSDNIRDQLHTLDPYLDVQVVPPGVNIPERRKTHTAGPATNLLFVGAMWRRENIDGVLYFYHEVFPRVRAAIPGARLIVVGGSPPKEILRLNTDAGVEVTGYVDELLPHYLRGDVAIAPLRVAGGLLCKVLDAMAAGLPVVASTAANEGVGAAPDEEILLADTPAQFADALIALLRSEARRAALSAKALEMLRRRFSWDASIRKLEDVYTACLFARSCRQGVGA